MKAEANAPSTSPRSRQSKSTSPSPAPGQGGSLMQSQAPSASQAQVQVKQRPMASSRPRIQRQRPLPKLKPKPKPKHKPKASGNIQGIYQVEAQANFKAKPKLEAHAMHLDLDCPPTGQSRDNCKSRSARQLQRDRVCTDRNHYDVEKETCVCNKNILGDSSGTVVAVNSPLVIQ